MKNCLSGPSQKTRDRALKEAIQEEIACVNQMLRKKPYHIQVETLWGSEEGILKCVSEQWIGTVVLKKHKHTFLLDEPTKTRLFLDLGLERHHWFVRKLA